MGVIESIIWFLPWLTEAWLWEKSINIVVITSTIYHRDKSSGFCENVNSAGYDIGGVFYCQ